MSKPIIFFSHSSKDQEVLSRLKDLFVDKTGGTIDVFLSSDGQSIPLGRNWVHRVEEALMETTVMVIFITPNSSRSSWIYFEAGFAYSKGIRVVPVGFLGTDLSSLPPPLSLLQGFNIVNQDGLDNLIALVNEVYKYTHKSRFSEAEYKMLIAQGKQFAMHPLGEYAPLIDEISIKTLEKDGWIHSVDECISRSKEILEHNNIPYRFTHTYISILNVFGLTILFSANPSDQSITFDLDTTLVDKTLPLVTEILGNIRKGGVTNVPIQLDFVSRVSCIARHHNLTAGLYGSKVIFGDKTLLIYDDLSFDISVNYNYSPTGTTYLRILPQTDSFSLDKVGELLKILFDKGMLFLNEPTF